MLRLVSLFPICLLPFLLFGQPPRVLKLENPSLEGAPGPGRLPAGWYFCGLRNGTPPDLHPNMIFGVSLPAREGNTYVGLVARKDGSREGIGQLLSAPAPAGACYEFSLFAARSADYLSVDRQTREPINFNQPLVLRLYGGNRSCEKGQLLATSPPVRYPEWELLRFVFHLDTTIRHLWLEVDFPPGDKRLPGNVLVDGLSPLFPVDCQTGAYRFEVDTLERVPVNSQLHWRAYLKRSAICLEFNAQDEIKTGAYYWQDSRVLRYGSRALHSLALGMKYFPEEVLEIAVSGDSPGQRKQRKRAIRRAWKELGSPTGQLRLRNWRKKKDRNWLATNEFVAVRLR